MLTSLLFFFLQQGNTKKSKKLIKLVNIEEYLHIFWTTWGISVKFSEKTWLMIKLKITKKRDFTLSLEMSFLEKPQGAQIDPSTLLLPQSLISLFRISRQKKTWLLHLPETLKVYKNNFNTSMHWNKKFKFYAYALPSMSKRRLEIQN